MARKLRKQHSETAQSMTEKLTMSLFAPGMSPLHRAGLGGLACTLKYIEREVAAGRLEDDEVPGGPWADERPPWTIAPLEVTLCFGKPENAEGFLRRLFEIAFALRDDLVFVPGQYPGIVPSLPVRASLQQGITLTFLQHGRTRKLSKSETVCQYQPEGEDGQTIELAYKKCSGYKHQEGWKDLVDRHGRLTTKVVEVVGPMNPGAIVRHIAFTGKTKLEEDPSHILPLYFSLIGCLALPINRGSGVLIVPEVTDLVQFCEIRAWITPTTIRQCQITSAGDAALQAQIRLRMKRIVDDNELPACHGIEFRPMPWATQQKSRARTIFILPGNEKRLDQFEVAMAELPPRIRSRVVSETKGKGKQKEKIERTEWFWVDSVIRPLVADNLARGRPWYEGFVKLMVKLDPVSKKPVRDKLHFEKKGLHAMIEKISWQEQGESTVVLAVHEAMRRRFGQIASENKSNPVAMKNRWKGEYDRWRLAFAGAKMPDQFRRCLCDLFSRAGINSVLQQQWQELLPMLSTDRWQLTRDLALLALASYPGSGAKEIEDVVSETETE